MASSGSKKSKTKWKTVDASQIIDSKAPRKVTASWADDSNNDLDDSYDYGRKTDFNNIVLPTAPRAARGPENDANIPKEPPFQLYVSNLAYEVTEDDLADFFSNLRVKSVKIPKDDRGNTKEVRSKGYGYVEFEDRESLIEALSIPDTTCKNRRMRISVADNSDQGRGGRGGMSDRGPNDPDRTMGDWRSGPRSDPEPSDRDGFRSGPRRDFTNSEGGMFGDRDRRGGGGFRDDDRGGFRNRDGYRDNRGGGFGRDGGGFRDERGGSSFRDRGGDRGGFRDNDSDRFERRGFDDRRSDYGGGGGSSWRRDPESRQERNFDDKVRDEMAPSGEPKTRTRLNLQPRTKPVEETKNKEDNRSTPAQATASIFGGAKPVDTAAREREIEDRLNKQRESGPLNESKSGARDSVINKEISSSRDETSASSLEPAPPPRENAWAKRTNSQVNNGRISPHEDGETHKPRDTSPSNEPRKYQPPRRIPQDDRRRDERGGSGPVKGGARGGGARHVDSKLPAQPPKPREQKKESTDETLKMPKVQEHQAPNFIGSNKYAYLEDSESVVD